MVKSCRTCTRVLLLEHFALTGKGRWRRGECRDCHRERKAAWRAANPEPGRPPTPASIKTRARQQVKYALRVGKLHRHPCQVCGNPDTHAHHDDYTRPLEVRWLCPTHHAREHHPIH